MSRITAIALMTPLVWAILIWSVNRLAVRCAPARGNRPVFLISATSPLLGMMLWLFVMRLFHGDPTRAFLDPAARIFLLSIGLPMIIITTMIAYHGSEGQTA